MLFLSYSSQEIKVSAKYINYLAERKKLVKLRVLTGKITSCAA
jgi:hypothetical protein